jgi:predicted RNA-binding protein with PUA-like domain
MKSEPDCFGIDDLKRVKKEPWDGVRNYQVRNMFRDEFKVGDKAIFYHSNAGKETGAVGVMTIASEAYPDPTQFDPTPTFSSPEQVAALKKLAKKFQSKTTQLSLHFSGKNNEKVRVEVDPKSDHPDPKSDPDNPRWLLVDVSYESHFKEPVLLSKIRLDPKLETLPLLARGNRLSVMPISKKHFDYLCKLGNV